MLKGAQILEENIYFCMPVQQLENDFHFDASGVDDIIGKIIRQNVTKNSTVKLSDISKDAEEDSLELIRSKIATILQTVSYTHLTLPTIYSV